MSTQFAINNTHLQDVARFSELDPQLRRLQQQYYVARPDLLDNFPDKTPGIYTLGGGRQVGKTTLLKQWMAHLLKLGKKPKTIYFLSGELIDDHHVLLRLFQERLTEMPTNELCYLILDEVTYIKDWDKAVKFAADTGMLDNVVLMLTGSDLAFIQAARMRFPGRRGKARVVDFHLYPLSFREYLFLIGMVEKFPEIVATTENISTVAISELYAAFHDYLVSGGYLTAINDIAMHKQITAATLATYSDWIRGDMLKHGKQEQYLREILVAIIKHYNSQITWNTLAHALSIDHPKTVADYVELLASMDAVFIQPALLEDKLTAAPKKAKKLMFTDPFIYHAIFYWLKPTSDPYAEQIVTMLEDAELTSKLVEATVITHYRRYYPTYYIKAKGEIDVAYLERGTFWPIEIKWTNQTRVKDLAQVLKYPNSKILTKSSKKSAINNTPTEPLPLALARIALE